MRVVLCAAALFLSTFAAIPGAQTASIVGVVRDDTGGLLPGAVAELSQGNRVVSQAVTNKAGEYRFDGVEPGEYRLRVSLVNFGTGTRRVSVSGAAPARADIVMHLALSAEVSVTARSAFTNLADAENPTESLIGIAQSASQGAITARQLESRPIMRSGEVLETVPGAIVSQHSGEGKANQYYLRGFNLDHGTDFATTVAGVPVNLPTHAHGQGYSDLNFLIPELVSSVQFSKGPYFADQGDFATAGAANINYTNTVPHQLVRLAGGEEGFARALVAVSPRIGRGNLLAAFEVEHNDGPWTRADDYRKVNGILRYTQGDSVSGFSVTGMAYRGSWNSTDQVPVRAVTEGVIGRFDALDATDGGTTYRFSGSLEWQRTKGNRITKVTAYGVGYDLDLFSNFTYFLNDPDHGDQFQQADHRFVSGAKISHRRLQRWAGHAVQNTFGVQVRNDDIANIGLYHTQARQRLDTVRQDTVLQTSGAVYLQNEIEWAPWLRTLAGIRADRYRFSVNASDPVNGGTARAGLISPKGGAVIGPFGGTELYANAGDGFHSNDARGATITVDPSTGQLARRVTPLVRARGAEVGARTVAIPHLQTSVALWALDLASELVFAGDAGTTDASRPSRRYGVEWATYYSPRRWLTFDTDVSVSRARFTDVDPGGDRIPGSVETVLSAGASINSVRNAFGGIRMRYFGSRPLTQDNLVRSKPTSLVNVDGGYKMRRNVRIALDVFNVLNTAASDIDYYYASRLPGEPVGGIADIHFHPTVPRTARISLVLGF